jgi:hypothetical protein
MADFTIENFWKRRLSVERVKDASLVKGWSYANAGLKTFTEAPLSHSTEFGAGSDPDGSSIIVVAAAGAVGKSTLARQIAFETGAVYVDLAKADPVGANSLSGGLIKSGVYASWNAGRSAVLIDALDEARLRVTQGAFDAFLSDVADVSGGRDVPTVLFGRTGAAQDAWLILAEKGLDVPVLEIGYFNHDASILFAEATLDVLHPDSPHAGVESQVLRLLLEKLRIETEIDGDRFAGRGRARGERR